MKEGAHRQLCFSEQAERRPPQESLKLYWQKAPNGGETLRNTLHGVKRSLFAAQSPKMRRSVVNHKPHRGSSGPRHFEGVPHHHEHFGPCSRRQRYEPDGHWPSHHSCPRGGGSHFSEPLLRMHVHAHCRRGRPIANTQARHVRHFAGRARQERAATAKGPDAVWTASNALNGEVSSSKHCECSIASSFEATTIKNSHRNQPTQ